LSAYINVVKFYKQANLKLDVKLTRVMLKFPSR